MDFSTLQNDDCCIQLQNNKNSLCTPVTLPNRLTLQLGDTVVIKCDVDETWNSNTCVGLVEPIDEEVASNDFWCMPASVDVRDGVVKLTVSNVTDDVVTLDNGTSVATLQPIDDVHVIRVQYQNS